VVTGTLHWLEAARQVCPRVPFIFLSSTQVYGDRANTIAMEESASRIDFGAPAYLNGLTEDFPIEGSTHALRGAAAVAADVLVQEFARSFHLPACCFRVDALCDPGNGAQDPRDFLSQIVHGCRTGAEYVVQGNQGRQVREVVAARDVAALIEAFLERPQPGEVYNVGGGKSSSCSQLEAMQWVESLVGKPLRRRYDQARPLGEPDCYYSDPRHLRQHFPEWRVSETWRQTAQRVVEAQPSGERD
jgi:CDP-paratose 2-epimerase